LPHQITANCLKRRLAVNISPKQWTVITYHSCPRILKIPPDQLNQSEFSQTIQGSAMRGVLNPQHANVFRVARIHENEK
jgi:hypothetical protein